MSPSEDETKVDAAQLAPVEPLWPVEPIWVDPPKADLAARMLADAPELAGYAVERELARGGQGAVYLARDRKHRGQVAIKLLLNGNEEDARIRFTREATVLRRVQLRRTTTICAQ